MVDQQVDQGVPDTEPTASDADLDAVLNRAKNSLIASKPESQQRAVQEVEEPDESTEAPLSSDEPDEPIEDVPEEAQDDEFDQILTRLSEEKDQAESLESSEAQAPDEYEEQEGKDVDFSKLSRKQRGKLIAQLQKKQEEINANLEAEQRRRQELEQERKKREIEDRMFDQEVAKVLGTDDEYQRTLDEALNPYSDDTVKERARIWKNNRTFYGKLIQKARRDVRDQFIDVWMGTVKNLPGVDPNAVQGALHTALQHIYAAAYVRGENSKQAEIDTLRKQKEALESRLKTTARRVAASTTRSPISGGQAVGPRKPVQLRELLLGDDGLPTDASERAIREGKLSLSR